MYIGVGGITDDLSYMYTRYKPYLPIPHKILCIGMHDMLGYYGYMLLLLLDNPRNRPSGNRTPKRNRSLFFRFLALSVYKSHRV